MTEYLAKNMILKKCNINNKDELLALGNIIAQTFNQNESLINDITEDESSEKSFD